jgi:putative transposase
MISSDLPQRKLHRLPPAVYAAPHHEFFFTLCARHQGTPFNNPLLSQAVIDSLLWTRERYGWVLFCYCLMPDHLHFVCRLQAGCADTVNGGGRGTVPEGVLEHVARLKSHTTRESWKIGCSGQLWQSSSYDRVFDLERPFQEVARYVLENPVRKRLVKTWEQWPYAAIVDHWDADLTDGNAERPCGTPRRAFPTARNGAANNSVTE